MNNKLKIIIAGLFILAIISILFALYNYGTRAKLIQDFNSLQEENAKLKQANEEMGSRFSDLESRRKGLEGKLGELRKESERLVLERDQLQEKFDMVNKEKESLIERVQTLSKAKEEAQEQRGETSTGTSATSPGASMQDDQWANLLKQNSVMQVQLSELNKRAQEIQLEKNSIEKERTEMELSLKKLTQENEDNKRQLQYATKVVDDLSSQLVTEKKDAQAIKLQLATLKEENFVLSNQLKKNISMKLNFEKKLSEIDDENATLKQHLAKTDTVLEQRITDLMDIKNELDVNIAAVTPEAKSVQLPPIVVKSKPEAASRVSVTSLSESGIQAKVVSVDEQNNFVIIDKGKDQGVYLGQVFSVYSDKDKVATVEVIKLRESISACDIKQTIRPIAVGDIIK